MQFEQDTKHSNNDNVLRTEPCWMGSSQIRYNCDKRCGSIVGITGRPTSIKICQCLERNVLTQWMNRQHHIRSFIG